MGGETATVIPAAMDIRLMIHEIRGVHVMLDRDLAALYGVTTGALNQAVKRNIERFPERFMFQMSSDEFVNWKSQSVISNSNDGILMSQNVTSNLFASTVRMGLRKRPFVFTEHGVTMLSSVLRSETAVRVSIAVIDAFVAMRKTLASMGQVMTHLDTVERRQIADQTRNEARFDEIFAKMGAGDVPLAQIFYQGKFWDAKSLLIKFIRRAKKELVVIDPYVGVATLDMLAKRGRGVKIELVTHSNGELAESDFEAFAKQCGKFTKTFCGTCHDRFIVVDRKEIFWKMRRRKRSFRRVTSSEARTRRALKRSRASLKDAGRLTFAAAKMGAEVIPGLLESIRKAASSRTEYGKGKR